MFIGHLVQLAVDDIKIGTLGKRGDVLGTNKCADYSIPSSARAGWPGMRLSWSAADPR